MSVMKLNTIRMYLKLESAMFSISYRNDPDYIFFWRNQIRKFNKIFEYKSTN